MNYQTLIKSQLGYLEVKRAKALITECNRAMQIGHINTVNRAAMFLAQIGEESGSLRYTEEIGKGIGRDYYPYCGRTFIQVTWRYNYLEFGKWMHGKGLLSDPNRFANHPEDLAQLKWAFWGAVWYWSTHGLNSFADNRDIYGATQRINGGYNGVQDRINRWHRCLSLGRAILPTPQGPHVHRAWPAYMGPRDFFGLITEGNHSHGGYWAGERKDVAAIQDRLAHFGFHTKDPRGYFRHSTREMVLEFQKKHYPQAVHHGEVWHGTWHRLFYY